MADRKVVVTGMAAMAGGAADLSGLSALLRGARPSVCAPLADIHWDAHLAALAQTAPDMVKRARRVGRTASPALRATLLTVMACMAGYQAASHTLGIVVAGSNLQQFAAFHAFEKFKAEPAYLSPRHGYEFLDTHIMAALAEIVAAHGPGLTVGGASASGNVAIATALDLIRAGRSQACLVVGPLPDLSPVEWRALEAIGALASGPKVSHPFDRSTGGFAPGQVCAAILLESTEHMANPGAAPLAEIAGACHVVGANHLPNPDIDGESRAMLGALRDADACVEDIGLISAHATGAPAGDAAETAAIRQVLGDHARAVPVNAPKSLIGHGLHAAGVVELIMVVLQMRSGFIHGTAGLDQPIDDRLWLVGPQAIEHPVHLALSNSFGFGSIASSIVIRAIEGLA